MHASLSPQSAAHLTHAGFSASQVCISNALIVVLRIERSRLFHACRKMDKIPHTACVMQLLELPNRGVQTAALVDLNFTLYVRKIPFMVRPNQVSSETTAATC